MGGRMAMLDRRDGRKIDRATQEYIRINCVERWLAGEAPQSIIATTGLCPTTIYKWISSYEEGGMEALRSTKAPGSEPKLDEAQGARLRELIVGKDPRQYGLDFGLWTRQIVSALILAEFGVELGLTAVGRLLGRLGITPQKPLRRAYERDPGAVRRWKEEVYPEVRRRAAATGAEILFWDESGFRLDDQVGRTWGAKGQTPAVAATGKRGRVNSAVAVSPSGAFWHDEFDANLDSDMFCELLDRLMATRRRPVILILDSHPAHASKRTAAHIASYGSKLEAVFLPGYSPELNPVEYVNHYAKAEGPRKRLPENRGHLRQIVADVLSSLKGQLGRVRAFFRHPDLAYIFKP